MARLENVIGFGPFANRPAAGAPGALYFCSDTGIGYRDNGATWDAITGLGGDKTLYDTSGSALVAGPGEAITTP